MEKRPRFEYAGQSSEEILAHVETHSLFSVLGGLQWCIQAKARVQGGEDKLSEEERVFLVVMALISEVNNGGYRQFFWNRSRQHTPIIVDSLRRIQGERTAELTARAIASLHLREVTAERIAEVMQCENPERDAELEASVGSSTRFTRQHSSSWCSCLLSGRIFRHRGQTTIRAFRNGRDQFALNG